MCPRGIYNIQLDQSKGLAPPARVIAVVNQKGGVGKTTTAVNLAASLAASDWGTLLIDLDPQGNASSGFGCLKPRVQVYDALLGQKSFREVALQTALPLLQLIPATPELVGAEIELVPLEDRSERLKKALVPDLDKYNFIFIDCPPSLGLLTLNALSAADSVLIPMQCEYYALEGLAHLMKTISRVREYSNPHLKVEGIIFTMFDPRANLSRQVAEEARGFFGNDIYKTAIPRNVRLSEAPSHGKPALLYDLKSTGAQAYIELAKELLVRNEVSFPRRLPPSPSNISLTPQQGVPDGI
tara:strand:- start:2423 stop:3316 length:894 start_codon:yes stop_codon:yes gene_type:complete